MRLAFAVATAVICSVTSANAADTNRQEAICERGVKPYNALGRELAIDKTTSKLDGEKISVNVGYHFIGVENSRINGQAICEFSSSTNLVPSKITLTSNGATETLGQDDRKCYNAGKFYANATLGCTSMH